MNKYDFLQEFLQDKLCDFPIARLHSLKTFNTTKAKCYVLRDDELGFGISGSKRRKYASLLPYIEQGGYKSIALIGSAYSNHIVSFSQLLIEKGYSPILFLLQRYGVQVKGNRLLIKLLIPDDHIHWVLEQDWPYVEEIAQKWADSQRQKTLVVPEGACLPQSLLGSLTLPLNIFRYKPQKEFNHIIMEAGTGLMAIITILGVAWFGETTKVHVLLLGGSPEEFLIKLDSFTKFFNQIFETDFTQEKLNSYFQLHIPQTARSFGSVNSHVLGMIDYMAKNEGILTDPIYSAKLFLEGRRIIFDLEGNVLFIHGGGGLSLMGFQESIAAFLDRKLS